MPRCEDVFLMFRENSLRPLRACKGALRRNLLVEEEDQTVLWRKDLEVEARLNKDRPENDDISSSRPA